MLEFGSVDEYKKKLQNVNAVISRISQKNNFITPIAISDYRLFEDFFDREGRHTYGNSWLYITQGTFGIGPENLGYKYYDGVNLCALAIYPKLEQPDTVMLYWIRPMGKDMLSIIVKLSEELRKEYGIFSYVKKIFSDQYRFLLEHGFRSAKDFPWHSSTHSEDDTFPEVIYDREKTLMILNNPTNATQLGRAAKGVKRFQAQHAVRIDSTDFVSHAWTIVKEYFSCRKHISDKPNISTPFDYHNMIFSTPDNDPNVDRKVLWVDDDPVGFYTVARDHKFDVASIYSYITLRKCYKYLTDLLKIFVFSNEKTKYINGGGSEDEGIYNFKQKYDPEKTSQMLWATNYPS